jgi:hypothetical protein
MFEAARRAGILFNLDQDARIKAIQEAPEIGIESNVIININPYSTYYPTYCLRSSIGAINSSALSPTRIIF